VLDVWRARGCSSRCVVLNVCRARALRSHLARCTRTHPFPQTPPPPPTRGGGAPPGRQGITPILPDRVRRVRRRAGGAADRARVFPAAPEAHALPPGRCWPAARGNGRPRPRRRERARARRGEPTACRPGMLGVGPHPPRAAERRLELGRDPGARLGAVAPRRGGPGHHGRRHRKVIAVRPEAHRVDGLLRRRRGAGP